MLSLDKEEASVLYVDDESVQSETRTHPGKETAGNREGSRKESGKK
jgi:hypothetical protein